MSEASAPQRKIYIITDILLFLCCSYVPYIIYYNHQHLTSRIDFPHIFNYSLIFASQLFVMLLVFNQRKLYKTVRTWSHLFEQYNVVYGLAITAIFSSTVMFMNRFDLFSRLIFIIEFSALAVTLGGWRIIKRQILRKKIAKGYKNLNILILGFNNVTNDYIRNIRSQKFLGQKVIGIINESPVPEVDPSVPYLGNLDSLEKICHERFVERIMIMNNSNLKLDSRVTDEVDELDIGIGMIPESETFLPPLLEIEQFNDIPILHYKFKEMKPLNSTLKRFMDIIFSSAALICLSPVFLVIAILIKISSKGPVFFVQKRVGIKGIEFDFYKFRSMVTNAEEIRKDLEKENEVKDGVIFKMKNDPRITKIGKFLRKYSLDELPQLFNVLKGDMSIVGPRPPLMSEVIQYHHKQLMRLTVRPGLTGLPQIHGRSNLAFSEWVKWDVWYIRNWSLLLDLKIVIATIPAVLKGDGAY